MRELFEKFVEDKCPTFWQRVENWYDNKEEFLQATKYAAPRIWIESGFRWAATTEGHDYWEEVHSDWKYIVEQEDREE